MNQQNYEKADISKKMTVQRGDVGRSLHSDTSFQSAWRVREEIPARRRL